MPLCDGGIARFSGDEALERRVFFTSGSIEEEENFTMTCSADEPTELSGVLEQPLHCCTTAASAAGVGCDMQYGRG